MGAGRNDRSTAAAGHVHAAAPCRAGCFWVLAATNRSSQPPAHPRSALAAVRGEAATTETPPPHLDPRLLPPSRMRSAERHEDEEGGEKAAPAGVRGGAPATL